MSRRSSNSDNNQHHAGQRRASKEQAITQHNSDNQTSPVPSYITLIQQYAQQLTPTTVLSNPGAEAVGSRPTTSSTSNYTSPFASSPTLYSLTGHETTQLFTPYLNNNNGNNNSNSDQSNAHPRGGAILSLNLTQFTQLLSHWIQTLKQKTIHTINTFCTQQQLPFNEQQNTTAYTLLHTLFQHYLSPAQLSHLASIVFLSLDTDSDGQLTVHEFGPFLTCVDMVIGEQIRQEFKRQLILPRLKTLSCI